MHPPPPPFLSLSLSFLLRPTHACLCARKCHTFPRLGSANVDSGYIISCPCISEAHRLISDSSQSVFPLSLIRLFAQSAMARCLLAARPLHINMSGQELWGGIDCVRENNSTREEEDPASTPVKQIHSKTTVTNSANITGNRVFDWA